MPESQRIQPNANELNATTSFAIINPEAILATINHNSHHQQQQQQSNILYNNNLTNKNHNKSIISMNTSTHIVNNSAVIMNSLNTNSSSTHQMCNVDEKVSDVNNASDVASDSEDECDKRTLNDKYMEDDVS